QPGGQGRRGRPVGGGAGQRSAGGRHGGAPRVGRAAWPGDISRAATWAAAGDGGGGVAAVWFSRFRLQEVAASAAPTGVVLGSGFACEGSRLPPLLQVGCWGVVSPARGV